MTIGVKSEQSCLVSILIADFISHLGHFLFTLNLLPLLKATAMMKNSDVRIVMVREKPRSLSGDTHTPRTIAVFNRAHNARTG